MTSEFEIIERYFSRGFPSGTGVLTGIGDDAAILRLNGNADSGSELVISCDSLIAGVHFPNQEKERHAADLGYRCLAVNLSDLAAMGANPLWFTLALTLPEASPDWLQEFSQGLAECATQFDIALVGGDTCRGPFSVTIQVIGAVPAGQALLRSGAGRGDAVYVSGELGAAALWIDRYKNDKVDLIGSALAAEFWRPLPQVALGIALRGIASAAIDISDGLIRDLGHVLSSSALGARLLLENLPLCDELRSGKDPQHSIRLAAGGGDDYQLCFTVPPNREDRIAALRKKLGVKLTRVGETIEGDGVVLSYLGKPASIDTSGYRHFGE